MKPGVAAAKPSAHAETGASHLRSTPLRVLRAAAGYFGVSFGTGFVFGTVRILVAVPALGERTAELIEMPMMLGVVWLAARWTVARAGLEGRGLRLAIGVLAVAMLLLAEVALVQAMGEMTPRQWLLERDPVLTAAFGASMLVMAVAPVFVRGDRKAAEDHSESSHDESHETRVGRASNSESKEAARGSAHKRSERQRVHGVAA